jgi:predicted signal transduction protein with EAL and GGDEF domain
MADAAGDAALLYRLEGDEFGVLAAHDASRALELATRLVHAFQAPLAVGGLSLELGLAVGVAVAGEDADTIEELLRRADVALAAAKDDHSGVALYAPDRDRFSRRRLALMGDLRRAIADGEVRPYFQPQVDLRTGVVTGAEALVRWTRPDGSMVPPLDFIPSAERSGLIKPLTVHVLAGALDAQQRWAANGTNIRMAVNLSARSLLDPDLVGDVEQALELAGAAAAGLELEVTESAIMAEPDRARRTLQRLDELGVRLAIDDFGTGHSSLAYLSRLPVHVVKIDRSFVLRLHDDPAAELIVRMTVDLGHSLGLTVVAEGIEDDDTRRRVRDLGCDVAQGFLWSPAVPADGFPGAAAAVSARLLTAPA